VYIDQEIHTCLEDVYTPPCKPLFQLKRIKVL
jgi:hypothetical protein